MQGDSIEPHPKEYAKNQIAIETLIVSVWNKKKYKYKPSEWKFHQESAGLLSDVKSDIYVSSTE